MLKEARMPRALQEVQRDLNTWEAELDKHLSHCATCEDGADKYCQVGIEISVMMTRLLMEKVRLQIAADVAEREGAHGPEEPTEGYPSAASE